jgi:hypothetical protein
MLYALRSMLYALRLLELGGGGAVGEVAGGQLDDVVTALDDVVVTGGEDDGPGEGAVEDGGFEELEGFVVQTIEKFVNEEEARTLDEGACEEEAGALIPAEGGAADLHAEVQALRTVEEDVQEADAVEGLADLIQADIDTAEAEVFNDGAVDDLIPAEEHDALAEGLEVPAAEVEAVNADVALRGEAEAEQNV